MGEDAAKPMRAWQIYDALRGDKRIIFLDEVIDVATKYREASALVAGGPNIWTDAYLVGFATARGARLVTFDRDLGTRTGTEVLG